MPRGDRGGRRRWAARRLGRVGVIMSSRDDRPADGDRSSNESDLLAVLGGRGMPAALAYIDGCYVVAELDAHQMLAELALVVTLVAQDEPQRTGLLARRCWGGGTERLRGGRGLSTVPQN